MDGGYTKIISKLINDCWDLILTKGTTKFQVN